MRAAQWRYAAGPAGGTSRAGRQRNAGDDTEATSSIRINGQAYVTGGEERGHPMKVRTLHNTTQDLRPHMRAVRTIAVTMAALAAMAGIAVSQNMAGQPLSQQQSVRLQSVQYDEPDLAGGAGQYGRLAEQLRVVVEQLSPSDQPYQSEQLRHLVENLSHFEQLDQSGYFGQLFKQTRQLVEELGKVDQLDQFGQLHQLVGRLCQPDHSSQLAEHIRKLVENLRQSGQLGQSDQLTELIQLLVELEQLDGNSGAGGAGEPGQPGQPGGDGGAGGAGQPGQPGGDGGAGGAGGDGANGP